VRQQTTDQVAGAARAAISTGRPGSVATRIRQFNAGIERAVLRELRSARRTRTVAGRSASRTAGRGPATG
jgi:hypothetical protein